MSGPGQIFRYDAQNRMARAVEGGFITTFAYNALGKRTAKHRLAGGSGSDYFVYDDMGRLLGVYDQTGQVREELVWLDGYRPVATARGSGPIYDLYRIVTDRMQTPIGVLDGTGVRVWEWTGSYMAISARFQIPAKPHGPPDPQSCRCWLAAVGMLSTRNAPPSRTTPWPSAPSPRRTSPGRKYRRARVF